MGISRGVIDALDGRTEPGTRARAIRRALGRSRTKVARSAGLTRHQLAGTERGRRPVTPAQWRSLAGSLGVDPELLLPADQCPADDVDAENRRIDEFLEHDVDHEWRLGRRMATDRPAAPPIDLSDRDSRPGESAPPGVERSWADLRTDLDDLVACCDRLVAAETGDDAEALLDMLDAAAHEVRFRSPSGWIMAAAPFDTLRSRSATFGDGSRAPRPTL
jgi:transcriptional regulator with XRE-family HTH domain